jgi:hypothetical protein
MRLDEARMGIVLAHRSVVMVADTEERRKLRQLVRMAEYQVHAAETAPTKQIANDCFWRVEVLLWSVERIVEEGVALAPSIDDDRVAIALDGWPVYAALVALLKCNGGRWQGSASELLDALNAAATSATIYTAAGWPRSANTLAGQLARHESDMRARGLVSQRARTKHGSLITLTSNSDDDDADPMSGAGTARRPSLPVDIT